MCRNTVGNTDAKLDARVGRLHDAVRGKGRRHEDNTGIGAGRGHGFLDGIEHGPVEMTGTALAGSDAADDMGAVVDHFGGMERPDLAGKALYDYLCTFVN